MLYHKHPSQVEKHFKRNDILIISKEQLESQTFCFNNMPNNHQHYLPRFSNFKSEILPQIYAYYIL